jgi:hypothetical protein
MSKKIAILFLSIHFACSSQIPRPSRAEWLWSFAHPFAALKVKKITTACNNINDPKKTKIVLDSFSNGGKADAWRHVFYMAAYSQKIKAKKVRKLGRAHEKTNYRQFLKSKNEYGEIPDSLGMVMDLSNNELGIEIGRNNRELPYAELSDFVITEIKTGKAKIMKRNSKGHYLSCDNKELNLKEYIRKWSVPKCLVASDFIYE